MIVSTKDATFAITPAKIGIPYNASGIMHFIHQLGINKAREMFFLAHPIEAEDALNVGLINRVTEPGELDQVLEEIAGVQDKIRRRYIDATFRSLDFLEGMPGL